MKILYIDWLFLDKFKFFNIKKIFYKVIAVNQNVSKIIVNAFIKE